MWRIAIDEPNNFEMHNPGSIEEAVSLRQQGGSEAAYLAGGCDLIDGMKNQWHNPRALINLKGIEAMRGIGESDDAVSIGALTTLSALGRHPVLQRQLAAIPKAALAVATPQIRNLGTLGGNLLQDSRCPYYRGPWKCYRAGGIVCDAHHGINLEHAIFGGNRCYTVTPSDLAPVMVALDAVARVSTTSGDEELAAARLFMPPGEDVTHMHRLHEGQLLTGLTVPLRPAWRSAYVKYTERKAWDFGLVSAAVAADIQGGAVRDCRIVLGAVAVTPWRSVAAEDVLRGSRITPASLEAAARAATAEAEPLAWNGYKVPLVRKAIHEAFMEIAS